MPAPWGPSPKAPQGSWELAERGRGAPIGGLHSGGLGGSCNKQFTVLLLSTLGQMFDCLGKCEALVSQEKYAENS